MSISPLSGPPAPAVQHAPPPPPKAPDADGDHDGTKAGAAPPQATSAGKLDKIA